MHHDSSKAKHDIKKSKMAILFILFFSILFSPLLKKQNKAKPHKRLHGEVRFKKLKKKLNGKQVALHHDGRRDKTELF